jgi:hypothetical protein
VRAACLPTERVRKIGASARQGIKRPSLKATLAGTLLLYIIFVVVLANLSPKKADRYIMAVIPPLILLAGLGLEWLVKQLEQRWARLASKQGQVIAPLVLISGQLFFVISNYPYVLTFYNPLLGGYARAVDQVPTGWGEGIEQAVHWLNQQPDAPNLNISTWYYQNIAEYYMLGNYIGFSNTGSSQLAADYTLFYINQTTRQIPLPALVRYFQRKEPVYTVEKWGCRLFGFIKRQG